MASEHRSVQAMRPVPEVVWHDLEHGPAAADLELWEALAATVSTDVLEVGCGTGRVGLHLARRGRAVVGIERDSALVTAFNRRAKADDLPAQAILADVRTFRLRRGFALAIAPQQVMQQIGDMKERIEALHSIKAHLDRGDRMALAIVEPDELILREPDAPGAEDPGAVRREDAGPSAGGEPGAGGEPLPDQREIHGWVFSSRIVGARLGGRGVVIERLRERVSPRGERLAESHSEHLDLFDADQLEDEGRIAGLHPAGRRRIDGEGWFAATTVVLLERR